MTAEPMSIMEHPALVSFWDFQGEDALQAKGPHPYRLQEMAGAVERRPEGVFGPQSLRFERGQWLRIPRAECPALNFRGQGAKLTLAAWIKREPAPEKQCQAVAGMWNETEKKRQYCMFLNLRIWDSADQVCGHVSSVGGPTPGHPWCMTTAIGATPVPMQEWRFAAFTYDGSFAKVYLDGKLDARLAFNPFPYFDGLYDGGEHGADFTVGGVHRSGEMGNFFAGSLGGLAVFSEALSEEELSAIAPALTR
ncbi:Concanavalin A-like lectin/glucanases superfamily protein [Paenibacillus sp. UNCCL117]|uniref:LamG domain-containing protein n=1 Tax=unclassified Paenibacillus TaxID=185978 RepID=UPI00087F0731|nr:MULTISPECIES: LamG domain-containing protein [unclassified Paenibacillus]SDC48858.1 Concanavalin A-like lectin/glucanases superfamily protein [Paenibacillus sp. cl123]SFW11866.1 Concanavalin A-like lectin/glucanases superfamily protein [Paenibacillus sp. UNCCL117]